MTASLDVMRSELNAAVSVGARGLAAADALCASCVGLFGVDGAAVSIVLDGASSGTFGSSDGDSRRLDEYQFTFGEGPCLDAVATRTEVLVADLDSPREQRWPAFRGALLDDGIRGVFALPIVVATGCIGALDLFRARPGPLEGDVLAGALLAAELASAPLLDQIVEAQTLAEREAAADPDDAADDDGVESGEMDRVEVYQASGMLISALGVDADEAMMRLRAHAIGTGQTASEVAKAIIERRLTLERDHGSTTADEDGDGRSR